MAEMVIFEDGRATVLGEQFAEPETIVIYCDLCNEPLAITPAVNDRVFITCLKCHAVSHIALTVSQEIDAESASQE